MAMMRSEFLQKAGAMYKRAAYQIFLRHLEESVTRESQPKDGMLLIMCLSSGEFGVCLLPFASGCGKVEGRGFFGMGSVRRLFCGSPLIGRRMFSFGPGPFHFGNGCEKQHDFDFCSGLSSCE
jgi:hypothetical protein